MIRKYIALLIIPALAACGGSGREPEKGTQAVQPVAQSKFYSLLELDNSGLPYGIKPGTPVDVVRKIHDSMELLLDHEDYLLYAPAPDLKGDDEMAWEYFLDSKGEHVELISISLTLTSEGLTKELFDDLLAYYTYKAGEPESDDVDDWLTREWVMGEEKIPVRLEYLSAFNEHMVMLMVGDSR